MKTIKNNTYPDQASINNHKAGIRAASNYSYERARRQHDIGCLVDLACKFGMAVGSIALIALCAKVLGALLTGQL